MFKVFRQRTAYANPARSLNTQALTFLFLCLCHLLSPSLVWAAHDDSLPTVDSVLEHEIRDLKEIISSQPNSSAYRLLLAKLYTDSSQLSDADAMYRSILELEPNNLRALNAIKQLESIQRQGALLDQIGITNPFLTEQLSNTLSTLAENQDENLDWALDYAYDNQFTVDVSLSPIYVDSLLRRNKPAKALKFLNHLDVEHGKALVHQRGKACAAVENFGCAEPILNAEWKKHQRFDDAILLTQLYLEQNKITQAFSLLNEARLSPAADQTVLNQTQNQLDQQKYEQVRKKTAAFEIDPTKALALELSDLFYNTDDKPRAYQALNRYLSAYPSDQETRFHLMQLYAWDAQYPEALATYEELDPPSNEATLLNAQVLAWQGSIDEAQEAIRLLIFSDDLNIRGRAQLLLGNIYIWRGNLARALEILTPLQRSPTPGLNLFELDDAIRRGHGGTASVADPQSSSAQAPAQTLQPVDEHLSLLQEAQSQLEQGNEQQALQLFEDYVSKRPTNLDALHQLAFLNIKFENTSLGLKQLAEYAHKTFTPEALAELAQHYLWANRPEDARRTADTGLAQFANDSELQRLKALALATSTRLQDNARPEDSQKVELATELYKAGKYDEARPIFADYLSRNPTDLEARERFADSLSFSGFHDLAAPEYYFLTQTSRRSQRIEFQYGFNLGRSGNYIAAQKVLLPLKHRLEEQLNDDFLPLQVDRFLEQWLADWESKVFDNYVKHYALTIAQDPKWRNHKRGVFARTKSIHVTLSEVHTHALPSPAGTHLYEVTFLQKYQADNLTDVGVKTLLLRCGRQQCQVTKETWQKAKHNKAFNQNASPEEIKTRQELLQLINNELNIINGRAQAPTGPDKVIKRMFFGRGVEKLVEPEATVLSESFGKVATAPVAYSVFIQQDQETEQYSPTENQQASAYGLRVSASNSNNEDQYGVQGFIHRPIGEYFYRLAIGPNWFSDTECSDTGFRSQLTMQTLKDSSAWELGINTGILDKEAYVLPVARKTLNSGHLLTLSADKFFYDTTSCDTLAANLNRYHAELSNYELLANDHQLWYSLSAAAISDDNVRATGQFWYEFYQDTWAGWNYQTSINGWYIGNSDENDTYFSPSFYDSTYLALDAQRPWNEKVSFNSKAQTGASLMESQLFYLLRAGLTYNVENNTSLSASCEASQAISNNADGNQESTRLCQAQLEVRW